MCFMGDWILYGQYSFFKKKIDMQKLNNITEVLEGFDKEFFGELSDKKPRIQKYFRDSFTALIKGIELEEKTSDDYLTESQFVDGHIQGVNDTIKEMNSIINKILE